MDLVFAFALAFAFTLSSANLTVKPYSPISNRAASSSPKKATPSPKFGPKEGIVKSWNAMGLDAVVFKNIATLAPGLRERVRVADPITGELEFLSQGPPGPTYRDSLLAVNIRLGNVALQPCRSHRSKNATAASSPSGRAGILRRSVICRMVFSRTGRAHDQPKNDHKYQSIERSVSSQI
jgi:hypothetical protein